MDTGQRIPHPIPQKKLLIEDLRDFGSELTKDTTLTK